MSDPAKSFERRVSVAALIAVVAHVATALLWTGAAAERLEALEREARSMEPAAERLARLEEQVAAMRDQLDRIERRLAPPSQR